MAELVAVEGPPSPAWVDELRRRWDRGDAVLPVDHRLPAPAVAALYAALRPTVVVRAGHGGETRRPDGRPTSAGDALVVATSGTTGSPKGVVLTHDAVRASAWATTDHLGVDPALDAWLCCLPVAHAGGLGVVTRSLLTGTHLSVLAGFDDRQVAAEADQLQAAGRRVLVSLVTAALRRVDPDRFRVILLGGDAPPSWDLRQWPNGRPAPVVVTYGMTETGGGCVYDGVPLPGVAVRLDREGQIHVRGAVLARAYRGGAPAAGRALPGDDAGRGLPGDDAGRALPGADGWFATGDGGRWDAQGRLVVDGRMGDVIVTGGEKVWPAPVEAVLRTCPGVAAAAVVGRPDPEWGERVTAVLVPVDPSEPPSLDVLRGAVRDALGAWAAPKQLELVGALPTTALGKLRRAALR